MTDPTPTKTNMNEPKKPDIRNADLGVVKIGTRTSLIIERSAITVGTHTNEAVVYAQGFDVIGPEVASDFADDIVRGLIMERENKPLPATWRLLLWEWRKHRRETRDQAFRPRGATSRFRIESVAETHLARIREEGVKP